MRLLSADPSNDSVHSQQQTISPLNSLAHRNNSGSSRRVHPGSRHAKNPAPVVFKMAQAGYTTKDYKIRYRANIVKLFPQFEENETLLSVCTSKDALSYMSSLCTAIQQRYDDQTTEGRWSYVTNSLNEALVKRIHSKGTAGNHAPAYYSLKSDDFRDALKAARLGTVNLASLFVMAREVVMVENPDGIMVQRQAALPAKKAQPVRSSSTTALRLSTTSQRIPQPASNAPLRPPSGPAAVSERQQKTHLNNPRYSDLTVILSDREVHVHRVVLSTASDHFDSLLEDIHQVC
jgi:hypothetical protein